MQIALSENFGYNVIAQNWKEVNNVHLTCCHATTTMQLRQEQLVCMANMRRSKIKRIKTNHKKVLATLNLISSDE